MVPASGLYVRIRVNDVIRELDEHDMLPFETISINVALNGQDFVYMQGPREENSILFYRAQLQSYSPTVIPVVAPPVSSADQGDLNGSGAAVVIKGSGFFKVANRPSCGGESWHAPTNGGSTTAAQRGAGSDRNRLRRPPRRRMGRK